MERKRERKKERKRERGRSTFDEVESYLPYFTSEGNTVCAVAFVLAINACRQRIKRSA